MSKHLPDDMIRDTIRDLIENYDEPPRGLTKEEEIRFGGVLVWLDNLPPTSEPLGDECEATLRNVVEIGKRMRAVQQDYFRTRNYMTLRTAKQLETEFDKLIEKVGMMIDG